MADDAAPARSWSAEFFTHFKHDPAGKWIPTLCRFGTKEEAEQAARRTLNRVLRSDPHVYLAPDPARHCRALPSCEPPNLTLTMPELTMPEHLVVGD